MKEVTITFPKVPCSVDLTLLNAPLYLIRRVTHRRAMERMAAALARAVTVADGDPEGFAGVLAQVLAVTTGSPGDRTNLMRRVLLAVRVKKGQAYWEKVVEVLYERREDLRRFDEHSAVRVYLTLVEKDRV